MCIVYAHAAGIGPVASTASRHCRETRDGADRMSDASLDLNMRDVLARIDRQQAETQKFVAEQRKLIAEADKLTRDRWLAPVVAVASVVAAVGGVVAGAAAIARLAGWIT
jgi:hypothetical protein